MAYTGINFNRARMPARQGIIDPSRMGPPQMAVDGVGSIRQGIVSTPTMREALVQTQPQQSVAEILSEPLGEMAPDLGGATSAASRQRQIADMLLQGAQQQDNTSIAGGLSQLGQAFLARRAGQKADTAEDKQREMASLLLQQAMGEGPESQAAVAQLLASDPAAAINYKTQQARFRADDTYRDKTLAQDADQFGQTIGLQRDQFGQLVKQDEFGNKLALNQFDLDKLLGEGGLEVARTNAETNRMGVENDAAGGAVGTRLLSPEEVAAAGYPEGAVVQVDAKGAHNVRYKPSAEYSAGAINDFRNKANVLSDFQRNLNAYKAAVEQDGTISFYGPNNKKAGNLNALHQALIFGAKDLLNLGILSKDDYENLNKLIPDATGRGTWGQGKDGFMAKLGPLEATITSQLGMIPEEFRGGTVGASALAAPAAPQASALPPEAVKDLLADSSIEAQREFDEIFGQGAAQRALSQSGRAASRMPF